MCEHEGQEEKICVCVCVGGGQTTETSQVFIVFVVKMVGGLLCLKEAHVCATGDL